MRVRRAPPPDREGPSQRQLAPEGIVSDPDLPLTPDPPDSSTRGAPFDEVLAFEARELRAKKLYAALLKIRPSGKSRPDPQS